MTKKGAFWGMIILNHFFTWKVTHTAHIAHATIIIWCIATFAVGVFLLISISTQWRKQWLNWPRFFTSGVGIFHENLETNPTTCFKNHATSSCLFFLNIYWLPTLEVYVSCVQCHYMGVPTPEVCKGFRFNFGVGLQSVVPLDWSAHARGL